VLPRSGAGDKVDVLAAAATIEHVKARIDEVGRALNHEPERVGVGPVPLGNLAGACRLLNTEKPAAIVDLGEETSEFVVLHQGAVVYARTLSIGVSGLPESAPDLVRALKQTLVSWSTASDTPVEHVYLCGGGAVAVGIGEYLAAYLRLSVEPLPALEIAPSQAPGFDRISAERDLPRFAKAVGLALSLRAGSKDLNLRQGELSYQRGYGFLKDRVPLLAALAAGVLLSFLFSAWAESRALSRENDDLSHALSLLSAEILQEETDDVVRINELLDTGTRQEKDPQLELDAFELAIALAEKIPKDFEHDVAELDLQRGHVSLRGVVNSTEQAQKIAEALKERECFKDVKISQISQEVKTSRQKYSMEFDLRCEEAPKKVAAVDGEEG
jgi:general secretion pathway protein L